MSNYDNFALGWFSPDGCQHITDPKDQKWPRRDLPRKNAPPPDVPEPEPRAVTIDDQVNCGFYGGLYYSPSKDRIVVQWRHNSEWHYAGVYRNIEAALLGRRMYCEANKVDPPRDYTEEVSA